MNRKLRVFVFDDDPGVLGMVSALLKRFHGYEVVSFSKAAKCCVGCAEHPRADAIICDVRMPGMDGIEFVRHLDEIGCPIPNILLMSGRWSHQAVEEARTLDCEVIAKPFHVKALRGVCSSWEKNVEFPLDPDPPRYLKCNQPV